MTDGRFFVGAKHSVALRYRRPNKKFKITPVLAVPPSYTIRKETASESVCVVLIGNISRVTKIKAVKRTTYALQYYLISSLFRRTAQAFTLFYIIHMQKITRQKKRQQHREVRLAYLERKYKVCIQLK